MDVGDGPCARRALLGTPPSAHRALDSLLGVNEGPVIVLTAAHSAHNDLLGIRLDP